MVHLLGLNINQEKDLKIISDLDNISSSFFRDIADYWTETWQRNGAFKVKEQLKSSLYTSFKNIDPYSVDESLKILI